MKLNNKGTALVELAIILPLLLLIVFGVCEFGWAMYVNNTLGNAAREGARFAAVTPKLKVDDARVTTLVQNCLSFSYAPSDLEITTTPPVTTENPLVTVKVTLIFHTFTHFFPMLDNRLLKGEVTMRYEL
jgi:Flp pilus assembly protein TadG